MGLAGLPITTVSRCGRTAHWAFAGAWAGCVRFHPAAWPADAASSPSPSCHRAEMHLAQGLAAQAPDGWRPVLTRSEGFCSGARPGAPISCARWPRRTRIGDDGVGLPNRRHQARTGRPPAPLGSGGVRRHGSLSWDEMATTSKPGLDRRPPRPRLPVQQKRYHLSGLFLRGPRRGTLDGRTQNMAIGQRHCRPRRTGRRLVCHAAQAAPAGRAAAAPSEAGARAQRLGQSLALTGSVTVVMAKSEMGQGVRAGFAVLLAEEL